MNCPKPYTWRTMPNGDRTCDYCGSLHPDDFVDIIYHYIEDPAYEFEPSDKGYKIYARRPGVENSSQGGIKFYTNHDDEEATEDVEAAYNLAMPLYRLRFKERWG